MDGLARLRLVFSAGRQVNAKVVRRRNVVRNCQDTETEMKSTHIPAVIAAAAFGCAFPAWGVAPSQDTQDVTVQDHADQAHQKSTVTPSNSAPDQAARSQPHHNKPSTHPPTAIMDRATPPEKSTEETGDAGKHPPTRVMDQALPDQKAPASK